MARVSPLIKGPLGFIIDHSVAFFVSPILFACALRFRSEETSDTPRVAWGPNPLKPITYISEALRSCGYVSRSYVDELYSINNSSDFDFFYFQSPTNFLSRRLARYWAFARILRDADVLITNYDGGFLRHTPLHLIEHIFWRVAKKKVVVWPYGADSFVYSKMQDEDFRKGLTESYPEGVLRDEQVKRQIRYFSEHADFAVGNIPHNESCTRADVLTVACYGVDTAQWAPDPKFQHVHDGRNGAVVILHCPNHRAVKGTPALIAACDELKKSGLKFELRILEGVKQEMVREEMKKCDILAAQFLYGYASTEIEGMSLGKPVLSNLENDFYYARARHETYFSECPIVSTSPKVLASRLRELVTNPTLREELGRRGREYVLKYHSLEGQGLFWSKIVEKVWGGRGVDVGSWWRQRSQET